MPLEVRRMQVSTSCGVILLSAFKRVDVHLRVVDVGVHGLAVIVPRARKSFSLRVIMLSSCSYT